MRAFLHAGEGALGRGGLPHRRGGRLRLDPQAGRPGASATCGSVSAGSGSRRAGSRTSRAAITPTTRSGTGPPGSAKPTDGRAVGWNLVAGINDPPRGSERAIWVDGEPPASPAPASFDGPRSDRGRRRAARVLGRVPSAASERGRPFADYCYRQPFGTFTGTLPGGLELARGTRGDGAPRGALVTGGGRAVRDRPTRTRQRHGGSSPAANSYWLRPARVSSGTSTGISSSSNGVRRAARSRPTLRRAARPAPSRASAGRASR